jgi:uncharacterized membrane-anchored protein YjiN (DUF445 family)
LSTRWGCGDTPAHVALRRAKRQALALLLVVTAVFVATSLVERGLLLNCIKAMAEAAMVGALADWFAVVALFRRPLGLPIPHTAVIARNQERIGRNLGTFVRDKFLDVPSLVALMRRHDPAERLSQWLLAPGNAALLGQQAVRLASAALETVQDAQVERFVQKAVRTLIGQLDLSRALAAVLGTLTHNGRHQALLDDVLHKLDRVLQNPDTRQWVAQTIVAWLKKDHPRKEKMLPTDWLGDKGSAMLARALETLMADVAPTPSTRCGPSLTARCSALSNACATTRSGCAKAKKSAPICKPTPPWAEYAKTLWVDLRAALQRDLADAIPAWRAGGQAGRVAGRIAGGRCGAAPVLQHANGRLGARAGAGRVAVCGAAHPGHGAALGCRADVRALIELNIGKDLQYIRINGTVVGGLIGLVLFGLSHAREIARAVAGG